MKPEAFFKITYGLYIVSSRDGSNYNGHISNTVFQITADPPRIAIATHKNNLTTQYIEKSKVFSVSILKQDVSLEFIGPWGYKSGRDLDKFQSANYKIGKTGAPIVLGHTLGYFECEVVEKVDTGTHILFIGQVIDAELMQEAEKPLTYSYYREVIKGISPRNAPTYTGGKHDAIPEHHVKAEAKSQRFQCTVCGHIYDPGEGDPHGGIPPGTAFEDIPDDWTCPICGVSKKDFLPIE